jgi:DNA ligase-1
MKPQLADDAVVEKMQYPVWFQPKIDGVRAMHITGQLTGRSLDPFPGYGVTEFFSRAEYAGLDGEMTLGNDPKAAGLCNTTTGALAAFKGVTQMADFHWWLFDYCNDSIKHLSYQNRYALLCDWHGKLQQRELAERLHIVPWTLCCTPDEFNACVIQALDEGYEGGIARNFRASAKEGRPGKAEQQLVRVKPWATSEIMVTRLIEGDTNTNEKKLNTLGKTERSSAKAGKVPNGEVGAVEGTLMQDVYHPFNKTKLLFPAGKLVQVGSGKMTKVQAKHYWQNPHEIVGKPSTVKHLAHGIVDNMRMGTWVSIRLPQDMSS